LEKGKMTAKNVKLPKIVKDDIRVGLGAEYKAEIVRRCNAYTKLKKRVQELECNGARHCVRCKHGNKTLQQEPCVHCDINYSEWTPKKARGK